MLTTLHVCSSGSLLKGVGLRALGLEVHRLPGVRPFRKKLRSRVQPELLLFGNQCSSGLRSQWLFVGWGCQSDIYRAVSQLRGFSIGA